MLQATKKVADNAVLETTIVSVNTVPQVQVSPQVMNQLKVITLDNPQALEKFGESSANILSSMSKDLGTSVTKLKDMGEIGDKITTLMKTAKELDPTILLSDTKPGFFSSLFSKIKDPIETFALKQQTVSESVKHIAKKLDEDRKALLEENKKLEIVYNNTLKALDSLEELLLAGGHRLLEIKQDFEILKQDAISAPDDRKNLDVQKAQNFIDRFEQRLDRLNSSRAMVLRQLPQVNIMAISNSKESDNIEDTINTNIPLWETQINLYISQLRTKLASQNREATNKFGNELLAKNAELMHQNTVEIANASNSSLIDISTITTVQNNLLASMEVMKQASELGRQKRAENFQAIMNMDKELREKLQ